MFAAVKGTVALQVRGFRRRKRGDEEREFKGDEETKEDARELEVEA